MRISEAIKGFNDWRELSVKDINGYDVMLRHFCIFMRDCEVEVIKIEDIIEWLRWQKRLEFSGNTITKKVQALRKFFEYLRMNGYNVLDPLLIPYPRAEYVMPRVANERDYQKLLDVIPKRSKHYYHIRNRAMIMMLWDTGARIGEIISLNVSDLKVAKRYATIKTEKTRGFSPFRQIFWRGETNESLENWLLKRENLNIELEEPDAVFIGAKGGYHGQGAKGKRLSRAGAGEVFRKYSNKAGLPYCVNAHSFRHHFGHQLAESGVNNSVISNLLGHSSLPSSYRYTQLSNEKLREVYQKVMK